MREYVRPSALEIQTGREPITPDNAEADTRLAAGTRKLVAVMFILLRLPPIPTQEAIDEHIAEVAREAEP